jgi:DNA mismatch repair protein MutS
MKTTPLMEQYFSIRAQYPACLLFFQVGDFYELFFEHAQQAAPVLNVVLTSRGTHDGNPIPLCGVPLHAVNHYIGKLVRAGFHVALCDQLEPAKPGVVVKRGVTQVLTPATLTDLRLLDEKRASYLAVVTADTDSSAAMTSAVAFIEILTGQVYATLIKRDDQRALQQQLTRFMPDEIIIEESCRGWRPMVQKLGFAVTDPVQIVDINRLCDQWVARVCAAQLTTVQRVPALSRALELLYRYLAKNQPAALDQVHTVMLYKPEDFLVLDAATQRNLELVHNTGDGTAQHTLFSVLDQALTPMGSRMIKRWLLAPLANVGHINARLDAVQLLVQDIVLTQQLVDQLTLGDLERIIGRIALGRAQVHDYVLLMRALGRMPTIERLLRSCTAVPLLVRIHKALGDFSALEQLLRAALNDDESQPWLIKQGFDHYLDELRAVLDHEHERLTALEHAEQEKTGITSLKIGYNQVQGYFIEVTKANAHLVPDHYRRYQTLAGKERFVTDELQLLAHQLTQAHADIDRVEREVYARLTSEVAQQLGGLRQLSYALATLDALVGFALVAYANHYCRPVVHDQPTIDIIGGRHPVVAQVLGHDFIANDTQLADHTRCALITGPNMGGKSTYLRQGALMCIMAHCGSFVPAVSAAMPLIDRIFTRIGAGDNLAGGKSTFLVEMEETATICYQATARSLVILDEVGRGTSTHDGLAIAQAVLEYLCNNVRCFCLFATHYHELTVLEGAVPGVINYYAASKQQEMGILFLHKIVKGAAQGSFGIEVAQLAQLPPAIIARARDILASK